jgi:surface polysaccharide O-acyltransferase-like enzyme
MTQKKLLYEVSIIRPLVISLLVVTHSMAFFNGGWRVPTGVEHVEVYRWLSAFIAGFRIETIALVAGYVFAFQSIDLHRKYDFLPFARKKIKRLLVPAMIFGTAYYFIFLYGRESFSIGGFLMKLLSGVGHLWFLPMLFWCFLCIWLIDRKQPSEKHLLGVLAMLSMIPIPVPLPFGFHRFFHFMFYCYAGYLLYAHKEQVLARLMNAKSICCLFMIYIALVVIELTVVSNIRGGKDELSILSALHFCLSYANRFVYSCCGILALWLFVCQWTTKVGFTPKEWVINASKYCYGVYVYHQFIMYYLYEFTSMPQHVSSWFIPFVGLLVTFPLSYLLTWLSLRSRIGRYLIG